MGQRRWLSILNIISLYEDATTKLSAPLSVRKGIVASLLFLECLLACVLSLLSVLRESWIGCSLGQGRVIGGTQYQAPEQNLSTALAMSVAISATDFWPTEIAEVFFILGKIECLPFLSVSQKSDFGEMYSCLHWQKAYRIQTHSCVTYNHFFLQYQNNSVSKVRKFTKEYITENLLVSSMIYKLLAFICCSQDSNHPPKVPDTSAPHAVVLHDFPAGK